MTRRVVSRAFANIAIVKYWGKADDESNTPATPSISLALDQLVTETEIGRSKEDTFALNGRPVDPATCERLTSYLNLWREDGLIEGCFRVSSTNNFPTKSGLASSASGFAALAKGLSRFAHRDLDQSELSQWARRGSGSAARSIPGGLAAVGLGDDPPARQIKPPHDIGWGMVIAIVEQSSKAVGSTEGMRRSRQTSPYYPVWVETACRDYDLMLQAIENDHFEALGQIAEANALAMHACIMTAEPPLLYWNETTLELLASVRIWRQGGLAVYATIDAGANVALIGPLDRLTAIAEKAIALDGVVKTLICRPAGGAEITADE